MIVMAHSDYNKRIPERINFVVDWLYEKFETIIQNKFTLMGICPKIHHVISVMASEFYNVKNSLFEVVIYRLTVSEPLSLRTAYWGRSESINLKLEFISAIVFSIGSWLTILRSNHSYISVLLYLLRGQTNTSEYTLKFRWVLKRVNVLPIFWSPIENHLKNQRIWS